MKNWLIVSATLFLFEPTFAQTDANVTRNLDAQVQEVTVFLNQAQVVRSAKTWINEGTTTIRFEKISPYLMEQSLQVYADERLQILQVKKVTNHLNTDELPVEVKLLQDSLSTIERLITKRKQAIQVLIIEKDVLLANKQIGGSQTGLKADELEDILAIFRKRLSEIDIDWLVHTEEEKKLQHIRQLLSRQLDEYQNGIKNLAAAVEVTVLSNQNINNALFELRYMVTNASWKPLYNIRVSDSGMPVTFVLKAQVQQQTGEDWKNIKLKLSTSNPSLSAIKPQLTPQYVRFYQPAAVLQEVQIRGARANSAPAMAKRMEAEDYKPAFEVAENMVSTEFTAANLHRIPSGNQGAWVELLSQTAKATFRYATAPKADMKVFVTALVQSPDIINQIPAEAEVYFQGTYTGKTKIAQTVNDTLEISLGSDKRILVERKKVKDVSATSFFGSTKAITNNFEIVVRNNKKEAVEVVVEDQIPVTTDKDIEVKLTANPNNAAFDAAEGKLTWRISLEPTKSETLKFGFELKHPKNKLINGL